MPRNLSQTRGDTAGYYFTRVDTEGEPITTAPQSIYFTVKRSFNDSRAILQKKMSDMTMDSDGTWHFVIQAGETNAMRYGDYVFDVQVNDDGAVHTIAKGKFTLTPEATWQINED